MRFNVLTFEGFLPQNVLILFLFAMKHSYLLKLRRYFKNALEEYKVIYLDGTYDYITKDGFDGIQVYLL